MTQDERRPTPPWAWVPSLYLAQGLPYVAVMTLSVIAYKNLGISNTDIALYTSWLHLPWVLKPLWSPLVELFGTRRQWIVVAQFLVGAALAGVALTLPADRAFQLTLAVFWLMAFASASHDIAADGFYMLGLNQRDQAAFVGVRSAFYRLANIGGQGFLVWVAGAIKDHTGSTTVAWSAVFGLLGALFLMLAAWHLWRLPRPPSDLRGPGARELRGVVAEFMAVFGAFFRKPGVAVVLGFLLLFRFPEAQLLKLAVPFLLDPVEQGGLGLSNQSVGIAYGTVGLLALTLGGLLGGWLISRVGLRRALWPLVLAMHVPNAVFIALAVQQPQSLMLVSAALALEQFGYGLGFTVFLMYMIMVADGPHKTSHYAICTGFMALGMMIPGMWSGWLQDHIGYIGFFAWVLVATVPSLVMTALIRIPADFGRKTESQP